MNGVRVLPPTVMRQRTELALVGALLAFVVILAVATGNRFRPRDNPDVRASTYNGSREGIKGTAEALERLGVVVGRWRERPQGLVRRVGGNRTLFAVVSPSTAPTTSEWNDILALASDSAASALLLAGEAAAPAMQCFGYTIVSNVFDSTRVRAPNNTSAHGDAWVHARLTRFDSTGKRFAGDDAMQCPLALARRVFSADTILVTDKGDAVMLRLRRAGAAPTILLLADASLLRNRSMRSSRLAPVMLDVLSRGYRRVTFDEYHHGVRVGGTMAGLFLSWSIEHPLGWMFWQLLAVCLIALLFGAVRFGPIRAGIVRTRRSSLEHVQALATALAAARGHEIAIGAIVRGLRRRLSPTTVAVTPRRAAAESQLADDWRPWLASLVRHAPDDRVRQAAEALMASANSPEPQSAVLAAANAVEDLWNDLRR